MTNRNDVWNLFLAISTLDTQHQGDASAWDHVGVLIASLLPWYLKKSSEKSIFWKENLVK